MVKNAFCFVGKQCFFGRFAVAGLCWLAATAAAGEVDYEARFVESFPGAGRPIDWKIYSALVANDLPAWAAEIDPTAGTRRSDARLRATFDQQRKRVEAMLLYADVDGAPSERCRRSVIFLAAEFRLVLGESPRRGDPLALATIAPGCPLTPDSGLQLTAGRSPRYRCWSGVEETSCGWRLPDMPESLKNVVENQYPGAIKLRWRWRGLDGSVRVHYLDGKGHRAPEGDAISVAVPAELALQFVDAKGELLWTASAATLGLPPRK